MDDFFDYEPPSVEDLEARMKEVKSNLTLRSQDMDLLCKLEQQIDALAGPRSPKHRAMFEHEPEYDCITVYWAYPYQIDLGRIKNQQDALSVISHIARKGWRHMTATRVAYLIDEIMLVKGWRKFEPMTHENEAPPAFTAKAAERAKMTPQLRYKIIKRDGYRCRACGFAVQDGARLQVDHIIAVANGGKTEEDNLQTLCSACNLGKGAC